MSQALPERPSLEFLRKLSKTRLRALRDGGGTDRLADVQLGLAREYGFSSWRALKAHVDAIPEQPYEDPFVSALPEKRRAHKIVQWKPIMDAAFTGDVARVKRLLDAGADPNAISTTPARYRPLHRAIEHKKTSRKRDGHEAVVKLLLARGADPSVRALTPPITALQLAAMDEPRFVPLLRGRFGTLDIWHAAVLGDEARVSQLLASDRRVASARDENGLTPLHYCAGSSMYTLGASESEAQLRIAAKLLAAGADPNATFPFDDKWPIPVLYYATGLRNNPAMAEALIKAGADPCDLESVYHASDEGHDECLAVIEHYVPPKKLAHECSRCLPTQLHWGHTRGITWLLNHGANPNYLDSDRGASALHEAARHDGKVKVVALLLAHGADPNLKNRDGASACVIAMRNKAWRVLQLLESHGKAGARKPGKSVTTPAGKRARKSVRKGPG